MYYNKAMFDHANIPYPNDDWTWEEFNNIAADIAKSNPGVSGASISFDGEFIEPFVHGLGANFLSADGSKTGGYINSPESIKAVQYVLDMKENGEVVSMGFWNRDGAAVNFWNQRTAMLMDFSARYFTFKDILQENLGVVGLPQFKDGDPSNYIYSFSFAIPATSNHKQNTWEFLKHITLENNETAAKLAQYGLFSPSVTVGEALIEKSANQHHTSKIKSVV